MRKTDSSDRASNDLLKSMRKEMDKLRNEMKGKTDKNLDGMIRGTNSPYTMKVLKCPLPPKFCLTQLESFDSLRDLPDHITTFKMTLSLQ